MEGHRRQLWTVEAEDSDQQKALCFSALQQKDQATFHQ